jgi:hypothetical protein
MFTVYNIFLRYKSLQFLGTFLFGLSMGVVLIKLLCLFNIIDFNSKQYVYVDIEKIIAEVNKNITQQLDAKQLNEAQINDKLVLAKNKFNTLLNNYVTEHNAIVFSSSKVIAGADNVTEYFLNQTLERIK